MIKTDILEVKKFFENSYRNRTLEPNRTSLLQKIAKNIAESYISNNSQVSLNFICTHNSRRSQLGQVWAFFAADYFDLNISSFSGGTEVTAFHRNTVRTLKDVGFNFLVEEFSHQNPVYRISFKNPSNYILGFSKTFDDKINKAPFIAITTCDSADENCPLITEATSRFHLPFVDPKHSDNSSEQQATYLKTNADIASEIYYLFQTIKTLI